MTSRTGAFDTKRIAKLRLRGISLREQLDKLIDRLGGTNRVDCHGSSDVIGARGPQVEEVAPKGQYRAPSAHIVDCDHYLIKCVGNPLAASRKLAFQLRELGERGGANRRGKSFGEIGWHRSDPAYEVSE
jgi:hypothetical protein